jgi:spore coat protein A, manganese oxidase
MITRRDFLKLGGVSAAAIYAAAHGNPLIRALAEPAALGLSDPAFQPKFVNNVPNALDPGFKFMPNPVKGQYSVSIRETSRHYTGLIDPKNGRHLRTRVWGYGDERGPTWPGRTFEVQSGPDSTWVRWSNELQGKKHLLPVDTNLHWAYSLHGASSANGVDYRQYSIKKDGVPIITHLHGGNSDFQFDGNPEFFYSPHGRVKGPQWDFVDGGFTNLFSYNNDVPAGNLWYHDHALGITRLNVYAGLAGFYFVRDDMDTGTVDNPLGLPAFPYELAYAIQDRMFTDKGELFYPAFPGDPFYDDFITGEGANLPEDLFPGGGPTALAEFFGDHMVVNGLIWPKADVEPRNYRMHLLNGTDSRFMVVQFVAVDPGVTDPNHPNASAPIPFWVIGSDQGLGTPAQTDTLVFEPGGRYDLVFDFDGLENKRVIMKNLGGDAPFGGAFGDDLEPEDFFPDRQTDRIMAFDVVVPLSGIADNFDPDNLPAYGGVPNDAATRKVALFEGMDEFGRLQPLLGVVNPDNTATAYTWFQPTTETPTLDSTEEWEIYNFTGDAHPIHLHLVNFQILGREEITFDANEENPQQVLQHNGEFGTVAAISNIVVGNSVILGAADGYFENAPKDMVTVLPEQRARIKAHFDKPGRYVWHCHILSHEDHEMMRVFHVSPGA